MQTPEAAIITDPWVSADASAGGPVHLPGPARPHRLALITHGHQDHIVLETLLALRGRVGAVVVPRSSRGNLADPSLALYLSHLGLPVSEVDDFSEVEFPGGKVIATPFLGEHADLDIRAKSTYCVRLAGRTVFVGADSSGIDPGLYRYMRSHVGPGRHGVPGHGMRRGAADLAVPGAVHQAGYQEDERLADAVGVECGTGRRDHDRAGRERGVRLRDGRGKLAVVTSWPPRTTRTPISSSRSTSS